MYHQREGNIVTQQNKNGIPFTNNMPAVINKYLLISMSSLGIITMSPIMYIGLFIMVFPFKATIFLPQIAWLMSMFWTGIGQSITCWICIIHLKYLTDGHPSLAYKVFAHSAMLICILEITSCFMRQYLLLLLIYQLDYKNRVQIHISSFTLLIFIDPHWAP